MREARASCDERLVECQEVLEVADRAIKQQNELIGLQAEQISDLKFNYNIVKSELDARSAELGAWYRNPAITIPLSFVLGAYVMSQVSK
jgi:hypothetical protein